MRQYLMTIVQLNTEHCIGQRFGNFALDFNDVFLRQSTPVAKHELSTRLRRATTANYTTNLFINCQQPVTIFRDYQRMLVMGCPAAVGHHHCPAIIQHF